MCDFDYAEPVSFSSEKARTARKVHRCNECGRVITKDESYLLVKTVVNGDGWQQNKICAHCEVGVRWLKSECGGYVFRGVEEDLAEHLSEPVSSVSLAKLVVGMRRQWESFHRAEGLLPVPKLPRLS